MLFYYFISFLFVFFCSVVFTYLIRKIALRYKIVDQPLDEGRKIHKKPIPLLGGLAIFLSFFLALFLLKEAIPQKEILLKHLVAIFIAGFFLMIGGALDDKYNLSPQKQIIWPILAALIVVFSDIKINYINNPLGQGFIYFDKVKWRIFSFGDIAFYFTPWADFLTFVWLMGMIYTTKFLDGLDGLVAGITAIGALIIFFLSLCLLYQPQTAFLALLLSGTLLGFLIFNFHPAKIFLGESGSTFCGFILGTLAIVSGSKVATALLIIGIPVLDAFWTILRRIFKEHRFPWLADRKHLHFRLLDIGLSHRQAVLILYLFSFLFGLTSLFFRTTGKVVTLGILIGIMLIFVLILTKKSKDIKI